MRLRRQERRRGGEWGAWLYEVVGLVLGVRGDGLRTVVGCQSRFEAVTYEGSDMTSRMTVRTIMTKASELSLLCNLRASESMFSACHGLGLENWSWWDSMSEGSTKCTH